MRNIKFNNLPLMAFLACSLLASADASAKVYFDHIASVYQLGAGKWQPIIADFANQLFWKLVLVDFTWSTIVWVKDRKEIGELLMGYVSKIFSIGFFFSLLQFASTWIPAIIDSFVTIGKTGAKAAGADVGTLDSVLFTGIDLGKEMFLKISDGTSILNVYERIFLGLFMFPSAIIVSVGFAFIAGQLLVTLIESYVVINAGIILLGFGGSRWTTEMSSSYLKHAVGTGIKLMLCYLVIGLGMFVFVDIVPHDLISTDFFEYLLIIITVMIVFVYIVFNIPGLAASMMSGSPNMSLGGMAGAAITAGAGIAGAGAAAQAFGGSKVGGAIGDAVKGSMPGSGQMKPVNMNPLNGGGGGSSVQPPGSGLGATPSSVTNMPGAPKSGALAASFANSSATFSPLQDGSASSGGVSAPQTSFGSAAQASVASDSPASVVAPAPAMSAGGIDLGTSPSAAKAAVAATPVASATAPASPAVAGRPGAGTAPAGSSASSLAANSAPADSGGANASGGASAPAGDATGASIAASDPHTALLTAISKNIEQMAKAPENSAKLHDKISAMQKFVPPDAATIQTPGISMGHTRD